MDSSLTSCAEPSYPVGFDPTDYLRAYEIPSRLIYSDEEWNCREHVSLESCITLARQIENENLRNFLEIRPRNDVLGGLRLPFEWKIMSGHRRFVACARILKWDTIPCFIICGLSEEEAQKRNGTENLEREQLTFMEEALTVRRRFPDPKTPVEVIAKAYCRPSRWIKARLAALELPKKMQEDANKGILTQYDIEKISRGRSMEARLQLADEIYAGKSKPPNSKPARPNRRAIDRKLVEVHELRGEGFWLDFARWMLGQLSEDDLDRAIDNRD